jgi:Lar family restriction alleviation protein
MPEIDGAALRQIAPCPFCGAKENDSEGTGGPELRIDEKGCHFVFCFGCGATGPQHAFFQTDAIPSWNRRAAIDAALSASPPGVVPDNQQENERE